jgi:hypothetical protein
VSPIPLVSYLRARPLLLAWAESLGDTLDVCPLPTEQTWVYFSAFRGRYIKVGFTRRPEKRPFDCWRDFHLSPSTIPVLLISDAGTGVESLIKRAARDFRWAKRGVWGPWIQNEIFVYDSPLLELIGELRCASSASFFPNLRAESAPRRKNRCGACDSTSHSRWFCPTGSRPTRFKGRVSCKCCGSKEHRSNACPSREDEAA